MGNIQLVNTGSGPSTGDGDQLRIAFTKINKNFLDIVSGNIDISGGAADSIGNSVLTFSGNTISSPEDLTIVADETPAGGRTWQFKTNGSLKFPDGTQQITSFDVTNYYTQSEIDSIVGNVGTSLDLTAVGSDILPSANVAYSLGSPAKQFKDLYVGAGTIYVNGVAITEQDGEIVLNHLKANDSISIGDND